MNIFRKAFMKKEKKTIRIYLVIVFVFYFKKFVFGNTKIFFFLNQKHVWLVENKKIF